MTIGATPQSGRLLHFGVLRFTGPDSLSFLQGQLSNDTRRLEEGRNLLAAYSNPQGRVLKYELREEGKTAATWDLEDTDIKVEKR